MTWQAPWFLLLALAATGCATYPDVGTIKFIGFSDEMNKGKPAGQIASDDCVYQLFGYNLGMQPDIATAIGNARTNKQASVSDVVATPGATGTTIRYVDNVTVQPGGFNAYIFAKHCLIVRGAGYL